MSQISDEESYCFIAEWFDQVTETAKKFNLSYFPKDNSVSLFDIVKKRLFLRRTPMDTFSINDLHIDSMISVYSRQLRITDYADKHTQNRFSSNQESVSVILFGKDCFVDLAMLLQSVLQTNNTYYIADLKSVILNSETVTQLSSTLKTELPQNSPIILCQINGAVINDTIANWKVSNPKQSQSVTTVNGSNSDVTQSVSTAFNDSRNVRTAKLQNCTLCLILPHSVSEGNTGNILATLATNNYNITAIQQFKLDRTAAHEFLAVYRGVTQEYPEIVSQLLSGKVIALEIFGSEDISIVSDVRELTGPHDPIVAKMLRPDTLRAKYGTDRAKNAIHCTDLAQDGTLESGFFFDHLWNQQF